MRTVFTIGHSTHSIGTFVKLLSMHKIDAIVDVRSQPYSQFNPQYNKESLTKSLECSGIEYVFLGQELGARSDDPTCYCNGRVDYDRLAETDVFKDGIGRVKKGATSRNIALMCAEKDPLDCHRTILIARYLAKEQFAIRHVLSDGGIEEHDGVMARLVEKLKISKTPDMFDTELPIEAAYRIQGEKIAYRLP
jgi:uncharacterized protein (DUF488 family)